MIKRNWHPPKANPARRRGIGIELALLALVVIFGMSALLVSTAMLEKNQLQQEKSAMAQRMELDRLAEEFCACTDKVNWQPTESVYTASVSSDGCTLLLMLGDTPLLTVVLSYHNGTYTVTQWIHH